MELSNLKLKGHDPELFAEGVFAPRRITATASGHDPDYDLELEIELERGRYVLCAMTCRARKGRTITSEGVNAMPIPKIVRIILRQALGTFSPPGPAPSDRGPTEEALRRAAWVYRTAHLMGLPPTESVSQDLDLPRSTAGRWVSMARQRGFLGKAEPRKAGERPRPPRKR